MRYEDEPVNMGEGPDLQHLDEQIEQGLRASMQAQPNGQDALDPELLRELQAFYQPRGQAFHQGLNRVWSRLEQHGVASTQPRKLRSGFAAHPGLPQERIPLHPVQRFLRTGQRWTSRASILLTAALLVVLVSALTVGLILVHHNGNSTNGGPPTPTATSIPSPTAVPFTVTSVDLAVTPDSIAGTTCGSTASFTYTATFHIPAGTAGGTIQFEYTLNGGRSSTPASVNVGPGETTHTYTFTSSGTLPPDHTYPGLAEVLVNSPNVVNSPQVQPTGSCSAAAAFKVTGVDMAVSPTSIAGKACGTQLTVTYTATFHIAPNSPGGTIQFTYTINNGRGATPASITVAAGQTTATYSFTWSGKLPPDHTSPEPGGISVSSPNQITSALVGPTGTCS
ncbi:MAG TPA: hypothetical protein VH540_06780 [Ktedonobacterales bacterium]|jgi:hypothetical protein